MFDILTYLNKYYSESPAGIIEHFLEKFGINVKQSRVFPELWLFKYDQMAAKWSFPLTRECRGAIVSFNEGKWEIVSLPWIKFFNWDEPNCDLVSSDHENGFIENFYIAEKADGTCIHIYYYKGDWRVSTLGSIETGAYGKKMDNTFESLFWSVILATGHTREQFCSILDKHGRNTYLFELCTLKNRVVTKYPESRVYLLGIRESRNSYRMYTLGEVQTIAIDLGVHFPRLVDIKGWSLSKVIEYTEEESIKGVEGDEKIEYPEGYIIYDNVRPRAKIKNKRYLAAHAIIGGENERFVAWQIVNALIGEKIDDIIPLLSEIQLKGLEKLKEEIVRFKLEILKVEALLIEKNLSIRKDYAAIVFKSGNELSKKERGWLQGYLMGFFKEISNGRRGDYDKWFKTEMLRTNENIDYWKEIFLTETDKY